MSAASAPWGEAPSLLWPAGRSAKSGGPRSFEVASDGLDASPSGTSEGAGNRSTFYRVEAVFRPLTKAPMSSAVRSLVDRNEGVAVLDPLEPAVRERGRQALRVREREHAVVGRPGDEHGLVEAAEPRRRLERVAARDPAQDARQVAPGTRARSCSGLKRAGRKFSYASQGVSTRPPSRSGWFTATSWHSAPPVSLRAERPVGDDDPELAGEGGSDLGPQQPVGDHAVDEDDRIAAAELAVADRALRRRLRGDVSSLSADVIGGWVGRRGAKGDTGPWSGRDVAGCASWRCRRGQPSLPVAGCGRLGLVAVQKWTRASLRKLGVCTSWPWAV